MNEPLLQMKKSHRHSKSKIALKIYQYGVQLCKKDFFFFSFFLLKSETLYVQKNKHFFTIISTPQE